VRETNATAVVEINEAARPAEVGDTGSPDVFAQPAMDGISRSIWQLTEDVLELFRSRARNAVHAQKRADLLWLDDLTETQGNTVIAVRQLCVESREGVTLKKLAETMSVTPAAASVMVDLLVKKKMLKRTKSKSDRRAILIRLTPDTSDLFDVSDQNLLETFMCLQDSLGPEIIHEWQRILATATTAMRQVVAAKTPPEADPEGSASGASEGSPS
jgi:DNA-binding MarR family transcriptional regulator